ncbi:hypothetical protein HK104_010486 [Borealophlyctis nickersoniae]|nr:hypothetical protein HK104_010486 [Borealophlyctis nickersoniae]
MTHPPNTPSDSTESKKLGWKRPYQLELFEEAKKQNICAYIDTDGSRALVSALLLDEYAEDLELPPDSFLDHGDVGAGGDGDERKELSSGSSKGPKKAVFLVPSTPQVPHRVNQIRKNTQLVVGEYARDRISAAPLWQKEQWRNEMAKRHVLVFKADIFLGFLRQNMIDLSQDINVLIIEDCQHATASEHPYNTIMKEFYHKIPHNQSKPRIFGILSSPLDLQAQANARVSDLQHTMDSIHVAVDESDMPRAARQESDLIVSYGRPTDAQVARSLSTASGAFYTHYFNLLSEWSREGAEDRRRLVNQITYLKDSLGVWCAGKVAKESWEVMQYRITTLKRPSSQEVESSKKQRLSAAGLSLSRSRPGTPPESVIPTMSEVKPTDLTPKVLTLLRIFEERAKASTSLNIPFRAIVFVQRRSAAKVLSDLINEVAKERFPLVKSSHLICRNIPSHSPVRVEVDKVVETSVQMQAFDKLREGDVNTLIVAGTPAQVVKLPSCRLVVVFDVTRNESSYLRSRVPTTNVRGSEYVTLTEQDDMESLRMLARARLAEMTSNGGHGPVKEIDQDNGLNCVVRGRHDNDISALLLGSLDPVNLVKPGAKSGPSLTSYQAHFTLKRYFKVVYPDDIFPKYEIVLRPGMVSASALAAFIEARKDQGDSGMRYISTIWSQKLVNLIARVERLSGASYGYAVRVTLPATSGLPQKTIYGSIRGTRRLAENHAASEACQFLFCIEALDRNLMPNLEVISKVRATKLQQILYKVQVEKSQQRLVKWQRTAADDNRIAEDSLEDPDLEELVLREYRREISSAFKNDLSWEGLSPYPITASSEPIIPMQRSVSKAEFYVTVISFGPQLEVFTRTRDPPLSEFHNLVYEPFFPNNLSSGFNHYYDYPSQNDFTQSTGEPRRTFAILTRKPIPAKTMPKFVIWLNGSTPCEVEMLAWNDADDETKKGSGGAFKVPPVREADESDDDDDDDEPEKDNGIQGGAYQPSYRPLTFSGDQVEALRAFQPKLWNLVLRHPPQASKLRENPATEVNGSAPQSSSSSPQACSAGAPEPDTEPEPFTYMIAPMLGWPCPPTPMTGAPSNTESPLDGPRTWPAQASELPSPPKCVWDLDWDVVHRVVGDLGCSLYDWMREIGKMAAELGAKAENEAENKETGESATFDLGAGDLGGVWTGDPVDEDDDMGMSNVEMYAADFIDAVFGSMETPGGNDVPVTYSLPMEGLNKDDGRGKQASGCGDSSLGQIISKKAPSFDVLYKKVRESSGCPDEDGSILITYPAVVLDKINAALTQTLVYTTHNYHKYIPHGISASMTPLTEFKAPRLKATLTYKDYVEKLGYQVSHEKAPLLEAHHSGVVRNVLKRRPIARGLLRQAGSKRSERLSNNCVHLVPDILRVVPFPSEMYRLALLLPSIVHKLENFALVDDYRVRVNLPRVTVKTLYSAFTSAAAQEDTNYQRLETLGDSFLKYATSYDLFMRFPTLDEGGMTVRRGRVVSNRNLYKKAARRGYGHLMIVTPFLARKWAPPGAPASKADKGAEDEDEKIPFVSDKGIWWRKISPKMLADFMEALVAAYYVDGGHDIALHLLYKFGLVSDVILPKDGVRTAGETVAKFDTVGDDDLGDLSDDEDVAEADTDVGEAPDSLYGEVKFPFDEVESLIKYRFKNRALLLEAMTHPSFNLATTHHYQRLEFLGDALLDWCLTLYFFKTYPSLAPSGLTELRQAAVSNESFARLTVSIGLHRYFLHDQPGLQKDIDVFEKYLDEVGKGLHPAESKYEGPKVAADLFEAVAGAVFIDSGGSLSTMWKVIKPLMASFLQDHANPQVAGKSPVRQFHEHFQKKGFAVNDIHFRFRSYSQIFEGRGTAIVCTFVCRVYVLDHPVATKAANTKTLAKRLATIAGLEWIKNNEETISQLLSRSRQAVKTGETIEPPYEHFDAPMEWQRPGLEETKQRTLAAKSVIDDRSATTEKETSTDCQMEEVGNERGDPPNSSMPSIPYQFAQSVSNHGVSGGSSQMDMYPTAASSHGYMPFAFNMPMAPAAPGFGAPMLPVFQQQFMFQQMNGGATVRAVRGAYGPGANGLGGGNRWHETGRERGRGGR